MKQLMIHLALGVYVHLRKIMRKSNEVGMTELTSYLFYCIFYC